MDGFLKSFEKPIAQVKKKYKIELVLIGVALAVMIFSFVAFSQSAAEEDTDIKIDRGSSKNLSSGKIVIDISGAVERPGAYDVTSGARLKDAMILAGGLSESADREFFARNFNLAKVLEDQEKIHIPSSFEVSNGIFLENSRTLNYTQAAAKIETSANSGININTAGAGELDTLPGIGPATADKIIQGRPYGAVEELLDKKILKKNIYDSIKDNLYL